MAIDTDIIRNSNEIGNFSSNGTGNGKKTLLKVSAFSDADFGGNLDSKSISGQTIFLGSDLNFWKSKRQECISLQSTEAELIALSEAA